MPAARPRHQCRISCCAAVAAVAELICWCSAVVAVATSAWLEPTDQALPRVSHSGLWFACGGQQIVGGHGAANVTAPPNATLSSVLQDVGATLTDALRQSAPSGCSDAVAVFRAELGGADAAQLLIATRALAIAFLLLGLLHWCLAIWACAARPPLDNTAAADPEESPPPLKPAAAGAVARRRRRLRAALHGISLTQVAAGAGAVLCFFSVLLRKVWQGGPPSSAYWGWSLWLFSAAVAYEALALLLRAGADCFALCCCGVAGAVCC